MVSQYHSRRHKINEEFFDAWSPTMAYVLGFWFADGYMRKDRSYRVSFNSVDRDHLVAVRSAMGSEHRIFKHQRDRSWDMILFSKHLYERMQELGCLRRKSRVVRFPKVPPPYLRDFIRGYFDGDGSVFRVHYIMTKNNKPTKELRSNFTSGSKEFLEELMKVLAKELGFKRKSLGSYNDGGSLKLGYGTKDTRSLLLYMYYPGCSLALERKRAFLTE